MQKNHLTALFFTVFVCFGAINAWASDSKKTGDTPDDRKSEVSAYVKHHNLDTHDFGLFSYTDDPCVRTFMHVCVHAHMHQCMCLPACACLHEGTSAHVYEQE